VLLLIERSVYRLRKILHDCQNQYRSGPKGVWLLPVKAFDILSTLGFTAQRFTPVEENKEKNQVRNHKYNLISQKIRICNYANSSDR
jgi:hypothetical protein